MYFLFGRVASLATRTLASTPFSRKIWNRGLCTFEPASRYSFLARLSHNDLLGIVGRLSPLALQASGRHANLTKAQSRAGLSPAEVAELRRLAATAASTAGLRKLGDSFAEMASLLNDPSSDAELRTLALDERDILNRRLQTEAASLLHALLGMSASENNEDEDINKDDGYDDHASNYNNPNTTINRDEMSNVLVEVRAGTGGDEAALFAAELVDMYIGVSEHFGWNARTVSRSTTDLRGIREAILRIRGINALQLLRTEAGVHRVQRVPQTETQGRIHTSTASVAVLCDMGASTSNIVLRPSDLRFDVYRASGAGGQHVNTTESAVRVTHLPTGLVATCQDERSQHRNRAVALDTLTAKVAAKQASDAAARRTSERRAQLGATAGERSDRIRTYNFPQRRVTDHRIVLPPSILKVAPSAQLAVGAKNSSLQAVLEGGEHLVSLMRTVQTAQSFQRLAHLLERADAERSSESDELSRILLAEGPPHRQIKHT